MLVLLFTALFFLDILVAVWCARTEPDAPIRKAALIFFAVQLALGVFGGLVAVYRVM